MLKPITQHDATTAPVVSVQMITYNHAPYIAQAIDSVLMQVTDFPVELVIGEDGSTDGTREIVQERAARHPNVIRPLLQARNVGMRQNGLATNRLCRGEFIATLEGDDYWLTTNKLQKQVEGLRAQPGAVLCGGRTQVWRDGCASPYRIDPSQPPEEIGCLGPQEMLRFVWYFPTSTRMAPRAVWDEFNRVVGADDCRNDWMFVLFALSLGKMRKDSLVFIDELLSTYREHPGGIWSGLAMHVKHKANVEVLLRAIPLFSGEEAEYLKRALINTYEFLAASAALKEIERQTYTRALAELREGTLEGRFARLQQHNAGLQVALTQVTEGALPPGKASRFLQRMLGPGLRRSLRKRLTAMRSLIEDRNGGQ